MISTPQLYNASCERLCNHMVEPSLEAMELPVCEVLTNGGLQAVLLSQPSPLSERTNIGNKNAKSVLHEYWAN